MFSRQLFVIIFLLEKKIFPIDVLDLTVDLTEKYREDY